MTSATFQDWMKAECAQREEGHWSQEDLGLSREIIISHFSYLV